MGLLHAGETLRLEWDASPDSNIVGYVVYYGEVSGSEVNRIEVGAATSATITGIQPDVVYFIYTTAINDIGAESVPSNLITFSTRPHAVVVPPAIIGQPERQEVSEGEAIVLEVVASGSDTLSYQWQRDGVDLPGANSRVFTLQHAQLKDSGSYTVAVFNSGGRVLSQSAAVLVKPLGGPNTLPTITTIANVSTLWDEPVTVTFTVGDAETPADHLSVVAQTSDAEVVAPSGLSLMAVGPNYSLKISPSHIRGGFVMIVVTVVDAQGSSAQTSFGLLVTEPHFEFGFSVNTNLVTQQNIATAVEKIELSGSPSSLPNVFLWAESLNPELVPVDNVLFGGEGKDRYLVIFPAWNKAGTAKLVLHATDGLNEASMEVTVSVISDSKPPALAGLPAELAMFSGESKTLPFEVTDPDNQAVTVAISVDPPEFKAAVQTEGRAGKWELFLRPSKEQRGDFQIKVTAQNAKGLKTTQSTRVTLTQAGLKIERTQDTVLISWPSMNGANLEASPDLNGSWRKVRLVPTTLQGEHRVSVPAGTEFQFFRIAQPPGASTAAAKF